MRFVPGSRTVTTHHYCRLDRLSTSANALNSIRVAFLFCHALMPIKILNSDDVSELLRRDINRVGTFPPGHLEARAPEPRLDAAVPGLTGALGIRRFRYVPIGRWTRKAVGIPAPGFVFPGWQGECTGNLRTLGGPESTDVRNGALGERDRARMIEYRPSDKEPFMNDRQRDYFRKKLLAWKSEVLKEVKVSLAHLQEEDRNHPDLADRASSEAGWAIELRARDRQRKLIAKIDAALKRLEDGTYGYCLETGEPISLRRLEARPIATLSIEAQESHERHERLQSDE